MVALHAPRHPRQEHEATIVGQFAARLVKDGQRSDGEWHAVLPTRFGAPTVDFSQVLSPRTLAAIGSRLRPQTGCYEALGISSSHYILKRIDTAEVERVLSDRTAEPVLDEQEDSGDGEAPMKAVAMDGKVLRGFYDRDLG